MQLEKLKLLLGITGTDQDAFLQFVMEHVTETILNYCNIETVPGGLVNTAYRMAVDLYRNETNIDGSIASITEGDTSVSYKQNTEFSQSLLKDYRGQLSRYRKVRWL